MHCLWEAFHLQHGKPCCRAHTLFAPLNVEPPAKVNLFAVGKEALVQTSCGPIVCSANEQTGARSPKCVSRPIVLVMIGFHRFKHAPTAKGVSPPIHETAGCTGIFELRGLCHRVQFMLPRRDDAPCSRVGAGANSRLLRHLN